MCPNIPHCRLKIKRPFNKCGITPLFIFFGGEFILMWKYKFRASLRSWHHWLLELRLSRREKSFCSWETWLSCHPWSCGAVWNAGTWGDASGRPHQSCPFSSGVTHNMIHYFPIPTVSKVNVIVMVLMQKGGEEMAWVSLAHTPTPVKTRTLLWLREQVTSGPATAGLDPPPTPNSGRSDGWMDGKIAHAGLFLIQSNNFQD